MLIDSDKCQRVIEYYLGNGYDLVDKYDEKMLKMEQIYKK
ncbi:hypothetical protein BH18THE1_BH18THE1_18200 [soil metagenome]